MRLSESKIYQILQTGIAIEINVYDNSILPIAASSNYVPDDILRVVNNKLERRKYKLFIQNIENIMLHEFNYEFEYNKYSVQYPNSVSKYYIIRKQYDNTKPVKFPISIKITDHNLTDEGEKEQEDYIIKKINKLGGYKPKSHQKQKPESAIRKINILDLECETYPEVEVAFREILSDIDISINMVRIKEYKSFVPSEFLNCKSYHIEYKGNIIQVFNSIDEYILWLMDQNLICRSNYDMNLDLLRFVSKFKDNIISHGESTYQDYHGIAII